MARTAVVAGTATAVHGSMTNKSNQRAAEQQAYAEQQAAAESQAQMAAMQQQMAAAQAAQAPAAPASDDLMTQLTKLADLKNAGILNEEEFAAAKAKLLT